jgi:hypothetical protein
MSWHHPDLYFFLCLAGSLAAFLVKSPQAGSDEQTVGAKQQVPHAG